MVNFFIQKWSCFIDKIFWKVSHQFFTKLSSHTSTPYAMKYYNIMQATLLYQQDHHARLIQLIIQYPDLLISFIVTLLTPCDTMSWQFFVISVDIELDFNKTIACMQSNSRNKVRSLSPIQAIPFASRNGFHYCRAIFFSGICGLLMLFNRNSVSNTPSWTNFQTTKGLFWSLHFEPC